MVNFLELVRSRRSVRRYKPDPVPRKMIESCIEAARMAPTACNTQSVRFIVVEDGMKDELVRKCLGEFPVPNSWANQVPVIIVIAVEKDLIAHRIGATVKGIRYDHIDTGIAGEHLVLQAAELGLGTCWIGWFKKKKLKDLIGIPASWEITSLITLGYPDGDDDPVEKISLDRIAFFRS